MFFKSVFLNFSSIFFQIFQQIRKIYLNSPIYNKKISKIDDKTIIYKPSQSILNCLIKFDKKKNNIEDFSLNSIWKNSSNLNRENFKKLHNFFWLFTLDLRSSQKITQNVIYNWIAENDKYKQDIWDLDILSKRIIAWIANSKLTYEDAEIKYKLHFNGLIKKQTNHLINEINRSGKLDDKIIGSTAIILVGLTYGDNYYLKFGIDLLKQLLNFSLDTIYLYLFKHMQNRFKDLNDNKFSSNTFHSKHTKNPYREGRTLDQLSNSLNKKSQSTLELKNIKNI